MTQSHNGTNPRLGIENGTALYSWEDRTENNSIVSAPHSPRSNWQTHLYMEVLQALSKMSRLPEDHGLFLEAGAYKRATDVLGLIQSNTLVSPPQIINEDGDTVLFSWINNNLKKYICIDQDDIELEIRKIGTQMVCSETLSTEGNVELDKILQALGAIEKNSSKV